MIVGRSWVFEISGQDLVLLFFSDVIKVDVYQPLTVPGKINCYSTIILACRRGEKRYFWRTNMDSFKIDKQIHLSAPDLSRTKENSANP